MSMYTTGELAKLCGVSVRTVQYYDSRNILVPSELSEGGRRLYSEEDLKRMRIICFLREADIPINSIGQLFAEEHPENVISILLDQQGQELQDQLAEVKKKLDIIENIKRELKDVERFSVESIGDIAHVMKQKKQLKKMRWIMVLAGLPAMLLQWAGGILWITTGAWWLFAAWVPVALITGTVLSVYYYRRAGYICPECHRVFRPSFKSMFWAYHTPRMRRLTCTECGHKGMCVEVFFEKENN